MKVWPREFPWNPIPVSADATFKWLLAVIFVISCIAQFTLFLADSKAKKSIEDRLITWYFKMEGFNWNEIAWWTVQKAENALDRFLGQQLFLPKAFLR